MLPWEVRAMRRAAEAWRISGDGLIPVLAVTAACFLLGGLVGCLLASLHTVLSVFYINAASVSLLACRSCIDFFPALF